MFFCFYVETVFKSDLLHLHLTAPLKSDADMDSYFQSLQPADGEKLKTLDTFIAESCHVVVFSLLLEYLPTSEQRVACCRAAWKLLTIDGLLLIVTPDSRRQHRNRRFTIDWRKTIESIGFARYRYEKLQHLHCMAFRKLAAHDRRSEQPEFVEGSLYIPQDKDDDCTNATMLCDTYFNAEQTDVTKEVGLSGTPLQSCTSLFDELPWKVLD